MARTHQLKVLAALDRAKTQRYHLTAAAFAGTGLLAGAYNLFSIVLVSRLVGRVYYAPSSGSGERPRPGIGRLPHDVAEALNGAVCCGAFVGNLAFGWLGDRVGRRRAYGPALALMAACYGLLSLQFLKTHGLHLLATSSACFLLDLSYYSQTILQQELLGRSGWVSHSPAEAMGAVQEVSRLARALALITLCGAIPGSILSVALIDVLGRRRLQVAGFLAMTLSMLALAASYNHWTARAAGFVALYNVAFFFAGVGPGTTTFVMPVELFPARLRCTCYGIAAAAGRAGMVLGAYGFLPKKGEYAAGIGTRNELFVLAGTNFLAMLMSLFVPETRGASLEVLSKEVVYEAVDVAA